MSPKFQYSMASPRLLLSQAQPHRQHHISAAMEQRSLLLSLGMRLLHKSQTHSLQRPHHRTPQPGSLRQEPASIRHYYCPEIRSDSM
jgi:hypothetical protein